MPFLLTISFASVLRHLILSCRETLCFYSESLTTRGVPDAMTGTALKMKRVWPFIYATGAPLCVFGGFLGPRHLPASSNIDWLGITVGFVMMLIAPLASFTYGIHFSKKTTLPRPSFDRHPFIWWDVLQSLRVDVSIGVLQTLGAVIAFLAGKGQPRMFIYAYVAVSIGILIGERLVYRVYKAKIAPHPRSSAQPAPLSEN